MAATPQHTYQILTKRHGRAMSYLRNREPLPNVWLGISAEARPPKPPRLGHVSSDPWGALGLSEGPRARNRVSVAVAALHAGELDYRRHVTVFRDS